MYTNKFHMNETATSATENKSIPLIPVILSVILIFTAVSCGGGGTSAPSGVPVANPGGPYLGNVNQALGFSGSGTPPSGRTIVSFAWQFGDGGVGTGATTAHTYKTAGNFTATLTVTDSSGAMGSNNVAVEIITAPVAFPGGPYTGVVGAAVSFNGSQSTAPPGSSLGFAWQFGDGATGTGATPTHTYTSACTCTVTLTVTDDTAGVSTGTTTATITASSGASNKSATPSTFFAVGPAANTSTQFAYVLSPLQSGGSSLTIETIDNSTGTLTPTGVTPPSLDAHFIPAGMITDPSHKFLYLYGGNSVQSFSIAAGSGALIPSGIATTNGSSDISANQALIFTPSGNFAFFITQNPNAATPGTVTRLSVDANTGGLGAIETVSAQVQSPQAAAIDPAGKFLYVSGSAPSASTSISSAAPQIAIFAVAPGTGTLTPSSESPLAIESGIAATSMAVDSTGRFIYAAGRNPATNSGALCVFTINAATGELAQSSSTLPLGDAIADATSLALSPSANFGWVFTISNLTGAAAVQQFAQFFLRAPRTAVHQSVQLFQWDPRTGAPTIGNSAIENDGVANQFPPRAFNLVLFSPDQVSSDDSAGTPRVGFLFFANASGEPVYGVKLNLNTGSFPWIFDSITPAGH
jgi:PKD repeat protein